MNSLTNLTMYNLLQNTVDKFGKRPAAKFRKDGKWQEYNYTQWNSKIQEISAGLQEIGAKKGDNITHIADNRQEWMRISMAITTMGCVDVPRGTDATFEDLNYIANHTESNILIIENEKVYNKISAKLDSFPHVKIIIVIEGKLPEVKKIKTYTLGDIEELGKVYLQKNSNSFYHELGTGIKEEDLASIIYTSGTTGIPKGVMMTHKNLTWEIETAYQILKTNEFDNAVCFLPPWHIAERLLELMMVRSGACCCFSNVANIVNDLAECKPTFVVAVPRVWEKIYDKVMTNVTKAAPLQKAIFEFARNGSIEFVNAKQHLFNLVPYTENPSTSDLITKAQYILGFPLLAAWGTLGGAVLNKVKAIFGGRVRIAVSGASALQPDIDLFFRACGIEILEMYGMTETAGVVCARLPHENKFKTLGPALPGCEVQLRTEKGEVIKERGKKGIAWHKGPNIMKGYYKNPEKTREIMDENGWLNSGDLLIQTQSGEFAFAGREKDTVVLMGGENIEPVPIEDKIKTSSYISQVMVVGHDKKTLAALIVPAVDILEDWAKQNKVTLDSDKKLWNKNPELRKLFKKEIQDLISNKTGFKSFEKVTNFYIIPKEFEPGKEMTETMKMKRNVIGDLYKKEIEALYKDGGDDA